PRPPAIRRQEFRSSPVAWARRGDQASGAAMVRPSASSTDRVSSLTATLVARAALRATAEELMPALQQPLPMRLHQTPDAIDFLPAEAVAAFEPDRVEPELGLTIVALDVHVRRLAAIAGVEEEPERPATEHRRHATMLRPPPPESNAVGRRSPTAL